MIGVGFNVRVAFSASSEIVGELIRDATGAGGPLGVNHALAVYTDPVFGVEMTLGANSNGLTMEPLEDFTDRIVHSFWPADNSDAFITGLRAYVDLINRPYDFAGLFGMAAVEIERRLGMPGSNPTLDRKKIFCSEYIAMVVRKSGYPVLPDVTPGTVDPEQLCKAMIMRPDWFTHKEGI